MNSEVVPCVKCGNSFFASFDNRYGGEAKCPHCGGTFVVITSPKGAEQKKTLLRAFGISEKHLRNLLPEIPHIYLGSRPRVL